jgi:DNA repair protein RadA/Sms
MPIRLREAQKLGFKVAIVPKRLRKAEPWPDNIQIIEARSVYQAFDAAFNVEQHQTPKGKKPAQD